MHTRLLQATHIPFLVNIYSENHYQSTFPDLLLRKGIKKNKYPQASSIEGRAYNTKCPLWLRGMG